MKNERKEEEKKKKKKKKKCNVDSIENLYSRIVVPPTFWGEITLLGRCAAWLPNLC